MSIQLGRCTAIEDPSTYQVSPRSGRVTFSAEITAPTLAEAQAKRQQFEGTIAAGGVEPFVWTEDPDLTGQYRVVDGSTSTPIMGLVAATFDVTVELERLPHRSATRVYAKTDGAERVGAPGATTEDYWLGSPASAYGRDMGGDSAVRYVRTGPEGTVNYDVDTYLSAGATSWMVAEADTYEMSPRLEVDGYERVGNSMAQPSAADQWVATNGIIRAEGTTNAAHTFDLVFPDGANPSAWGGLTYNIAVGLYLASTLCVLRPSRLLQLILTQDLLVIDLAGYVSTPATADSYELLCSLALRRGSHHVELQTRSQVSAVHVAQTGVAMTEATVGKTAAASADDSDDNRIWIASGTGWNVHSGSGRFRAAAGLVRDWGIGVELGGSAAVAPNTRNECYDHYWATMQTALDVGP